MNDTDVKDLFAAAVAHPDVDRIDTDAVLRGGRRRARVRAFATGGSVLAVLVLAGSLVVAGTGQPAVVGGPSPSPSNASPTATHSAVPVTDVAQIAGLWIATSVAGRDVTGYQVRQGVPLAVRFGAQNLADAWELDGECNLEAGRYSIEASGRFKATYTGPLTLVACKPMMSDQVQAAIDALTSADSATLTTAPGQRVLLTLRDGSGAVLAEWRSDAEPDGTKTPAPPACRDAVLTPGGSIADQETVDAVADRVRAEATAQAIDNLSVLVVHPDRLAVDVFWVGDAPAFLTDLVAEKAKQGVTINVFPARYTRAQMLAAGEKALRVQPPADDPASRGLMIGTASGCNDGSGIKVTIAEAATSQPAGFVPDAFAVAIRAAVGDMPVVIVPGSAPISQPAVKR